MKRKVIPELLDNDAGTPAEVSDALKDLYRIHRWFGGVGTSEDLVRHVARETGRSQLSLLDVASGSGELMDLVSARLAQKGIQLNVTLMDRAATHLNGAVNGVVGDALAMPFADGQFDIVSSALFVHHLEPAEVLRFMAESLRVARVATLINDLRRSWLHLLGAYAALPFFRSRLTWHDAPASVRRAYTIPEMRSMVEATRPARIDFMAHPMFRMGVILWK